MTNFESKGKETLKKGLGFLGTLGLVALGAGVVVGSKAAEATQKGFAKANNSLIESKAKRQLAIEAKVAELRKSNNKS